MHRRAVLVIKSNCLYLFRPGYGHKHWHKERLDVIEVMNQGGNSFGPAAAIYEECSFLCRSFAHVLFYHTPREANLAAHNLARHSAGKVSMVWHKDPPCFYCKCACQ